MGNRMYGALIPRIFLALVAIASCSFAVCVVPFDGYNVTEDVIFCEGVYNLTTAINVTNSSVEIDCNGSTFVGNGTGTDPTFRIYDEGEVTIVGCNIFDYYSMVDFNDSGFIELYYNNVTNSTVAFNISNSFLLIIMDNNITNSTYGMSITNSGLGGIGWNNITYSSQYGMNFDNGSGAFQLFENIFSNNTHGDARTDANSMWYMETGDTMVEFSNSVVNATSGGMFEDYIVLGDNFVSANTTANPGLNVSAYVTFYDLPGWDNADVYYREGNWSSDADIVSGGAVCNPSQCSGVVFDGPWGDMHFTALHFSSFAVNESAPVPPPPTPVSDLSILIYLVVAGMFIGVFAKWIGPEFVGIAMVVIIIAIIVEVVTKMLP